MGQEGQTTAEYVAALALMATLVAGVAVAVEAPVRQGVATGFAEVCRLVGGRPERCPVPAGGAGGRLVDVDGATGPVPVTTAATVATVVVSRAGSAGGFRGPGRR